MDNFQLIKPGEIRTRYAPAPTGKLHIGGARTALFNFLFARQNEGRFILRIEDTDRERSKIEYEKDILESLLWLGIEWDEGPMKEGPYGPYRQSQRLDIYSKYLQLLLEKNLAYYCFCSEEELETYKQYLLSIGKPPKYSGRCANLDKKIVKKYLKEGKKAVIRLRTPEKKIIFKDLIRGEIEFDMSLVGDFVIAKDQKNFLYNFCCVIDDFEMKISHVIRGEDHISNTPKQIIIQEILGFPHPYYAHLPLILGPDRRKLSKRHGAVAISDYKREGYLPESLINFMAFLGWNPGTEKELYSLNSLIKEFSLKRIQKGGAIFNIKKLDFLNGFYIRQKSSEKILESALFFLIKDKLIEKKENDKFKIIETGEVIDMKTIEKIVSLYQERLKKISEISQFSDFFFKEKLEYDKNLLKWKTMKDEEVKLSLDKIDNILSKIEKWDRETLKKVLIEESEKFSKDFFSKEGDRGYLLWPLRVALSGKKYSAPPFEIAEILGKDKVLKRIREAKEKLKK